MLDPLDNEELNRVWAQVEAYDEFVPIEQAERMLFNERAESRLFALLMMRRQIHEVERDDRYLGLGRAAIDDLNENCRLQALILVSEFVDFQEAEVWDVIATYGRSGDVAMRLGVATLLLEPFLKVYGNHYTDKLELLCGFSEEFAETYAFTEIPGSSMGGQQPS